MSTEEATLPATLPDSALAEMYDAHPDDDEVVGIDESPKPQPSEDAKGDDDESVDEEESVESEESSADEEEEAEDGEEGEEEGDEDEVELDNHLSARADAYGIDVSDFKGRPEALAKVLDRFDRNLLKPAEGEATKAKEVPTLAEIPDLTQFKVDLPEDFDYPELKGVFDQITAKVNEHSTAIQQRVELLLQIAESNAEANLTNEIDSYIGGLGSAYEKALGKGSTASLPGNSPFREIRGQIKKQAIILSQAYQKNGMEVAPAQVYDAARRIVLGDKETTIEKEKTRNQLRERDKQITGKPPKRKGRRLSADQKARKEVSKILKRAGIPASDVIDEQF
jgi:hypothetical protein